MNWENEIDMAVTVCDENGIIVFMNEKAKATFANYGGDLTGHNLLDCHPEPAKTKLKGMLETPYTNAYTIEKAGLKKLIYQTPRYENGVFRGIVEMSMVLPAEMPHFIRKG